MADVLDYALSQGKDGTGAGADTSTGRKSLSQLKQMFEDFRSTTQLPREQSLIDDDYYHGKQLTTEEVRKLNSRGQPDIVVNRTRAAINGILGVVARSHTDPKAWPRTPSDENSSDVATDCLRYTTQKCRFNRLKTEAFRDFLVPGTAAVLVTVDRQSRDVKFTQISWRELVYDPRSRRLDFTDARYMGMAKWMYVDDVADLFKDAANDLNNVSEGGFSGMAGVDEPLSDSPLNQGWVDSRNKRVMVVELYYRYKGTWSRCVFWHGGILSEGDSPFQDEYKKPANPIIATTCYIDRDNNRYGAVRDMRDLQDEVNKRRSKLLHILNSSQIQARDPSAVEVDADIARKEAARPDGVIPYGWEKIPQNDMAQGQMQLLAEAKAEMERLGPNPAVLGRQGSDTSGRALLARQQAGLVELAILLDQMEDWELRVYQAAWCRIKQFWTAPMIVRVTEDNEDPKFVGINVPQMGQAPMMGHNGGPALDDAGQPVMQSVVLGYTNQVSELDVDIVIDVTPATATIMQEQLQDLMQLISSSPAYAQSVPFEVLLELMQIPRKRQLIQKLATYRQQMQQAQAQTQQKEEAIATATAEAKIGHIQSQTGLNTAKAEKLGVDARATALDASNKTAVQLHEIITAKDEPPKPSGASQADV